MNRIYEYDPTSGQLLHDRVLVGMPKGNSKTELVADIGLAELDGPVAPLRSPRVVVSAASWDQTKELFGAATLAITEGPLAPYFRRGLHLLEDRILLPDRAGRMERIAAVAGTKDGGKPTCHLGDEVHEWQGANRERIYTVQGKSLRKRSVPRRLGASGSLQIGITTAGSDMDSLLGRLYEHGKRVATGEVADPGFLFLWWEADLASAAGEEGWDLDDPAQLLQAILQANPAAGSFLSIDGLLRTFADPTIDRSEFIRYNLNRFVSSPRAWLAEDQIRARRRDPGAVAPPPPDGTPIVVGFDGSYNRDTTALVGWAIEEDYGFEIAAWEPEDGEPVPREEVDAAVANAFKRWTVRELACDPPGWISEIEAWEKEYGERRLDDYGRPVGQGAVLRYDTNQPARMGPACDRFKAAVLEGILELDGSPGLIRHLKNAHTRDTRYGHVIVKDHRDSPRKIDRAVAAVIARDRAVQLRKPPRRRGGFGSF